MTGRVLLKNNPAPQIINDMNTGLLNSVRNAKFIDVRPKSAYEQSHVKNSINIPVDELPTRFRELKSWGAIPVILYCDHGEKSGNAFNYLRKQGIGNVYNGGGYEELSHHLKLNSTCSVF